MVFIVKNSQYQQITDKQEYMDQIKGKEIIIQVHHNKKIIRISNKISKKYHLKEQNNIQIVD